MKTRMNPPVLGGLVMALLYCACTPDSDWDGQRYYGESNHENPWDSPSANRPTEDPMGNNDFGSMGPVLPNDTGEWKLRPAPPAISGGTLLALRDGSTVVAADPDRDLLWIVDLGVEPPAVQSIALEAGDEPGRLVEDGDGYVHVGLRRGGAVIRVDMESLEISHRREVCPEVRGLAVDDGAGLLHVACRGGELVSLPLAGGEATRQVSLGVDLRDVVLVDGRLHVSRFRQAEIIEVDAHGAPSRVHRPPTSETMLFNRMNGGNDVAQRRPAVAWRTRAIDSGGLLMVHQQVIVSPIPDGDGGYGGMDECRAGQVAATLTWLGDGDVAPVSAVVPMSVLPVDFALSPAGDQVAVASAGSRSVMVVNPGPPENPEQDVSCSFPHEHHHEHILEGEPVAVEFLGNGQLLVQLREPSQLLVITSGRAQHPVEKRIALPGESRIHPGHILFHRSPDRGFIACASCHPEGTDDAHVWHFERIGERRTMTLIGGLMERAPFHWDADLESLDALMTDVFSGRMGGGMPEPNDLDALAQWMDALPVARLAPQDGAAVARGKALFEDAIVACATCHSGAAYTNNASFDVGTGGAIKTPTLLNISLRPPYMHHGCAETLEERFEADCGGGDAHGKTSHLSASQTADLVAYLKTL